VTWTKEKYKKRTTINVFLEQLHEPTGALWRRTAMMMVDGYRLHIKLSLYPGYTVVFPRDCRL
jgi:hypothetical protein